MTCQRPVQSLIFIVISLLASSCGPGQFLGPTITPSPTFTPTPTITPSPTPTLTPTITPTSTSTQAKLEGGNIAGRLFASQNKQPLYGAYVRLFNPDSNDEVAEIQADTDGQFVMDSVNPGLYTIAVFWEISDLNAWPCSTMPPLGKISFSSANKANITAGENWVLALGHPEEGKAVILLQGEVSIKASDSITLDITVISC